MRKLLFHKKVGFEYFYNYSIFEFTLESSEKQHKNKYSFSFVEIYY